MWDYRIIISKKLQANILEELHSADLGTVKMESIIARVISNK